MFTENLNKLVAENLLITNKYFDQYLDLIESNRATVKVKGCTDVHHIIPKSYFKTLNLPVDNGITNRINLLRKDHVLAHYYLAKCSASWLKFLMYQAFIRITARKDLNIELTDLMDQLDDYQTIYEETLAERSRRYTGRKQSKEIKEKRFAKMYQLCESGEWKPNKGKIWIHKEGEEYMIAAEDLEQYLVQGFSKGRGPRDPELAKKIGSLRRGKSPWNKGLTKTTDLRVAKSTETQRNTRLNFNAERKEEISKNIKNGVKDLYPIYNPETGEMLKITLDKLSYYENLGFHRGRKPHSEESRKLMSEQRKGRSTSLKGKPQSEELRKKHSDAIKGKIRVYNLELNKGKYIDKEDLGEYLNNGYVRFKDRPKTK